MKILPANIKVLFADVDLANKVLVVEQCNLSPDLKQLAINQVKIIQCYYDKVNVVDFDFVFKSHPQLIELLKSKPTYNNNLILTH